MKTFRDYLTESVKEYKMRIKVAGIDEAPDMNKFETIFEKYGLTSMSTFKKTPIQEHPQDFFNIKNSDVYISDASFSYPVTSHELFHYIQEEIGLSGSQVVVIPSGHPEEIAREDALADEGKEYVSLLDSEYAQEGHEIEYGDEFVGNFLKELETRQYEYATGEKTPAAKTTNDDPVNTAPVMSDRGNHELGKR